MKFKLKARIYKKKEHQKGLSLVELAIVISLLFLLIFGIIEFGFIMYNQQVISNAAREGARLGVVARPPDETTTSGVVVYKITSPEIIDLVKKYAENNIVTFGPKNFSVQVKFYPSLEGTEISGQTRCENFKELLEVVVKYEYRFIFLPFMTKEMSARAIMRCE